ncbi:MAG: hypothetical protein KGD63_01975 [Candidatus Lokiarchaeota archaeon]|nr:hypothetical protein [Candidatus Lokiarchaeota archaeon]
MVKLKITDIYAPIESTNLKNIIPEGEDIVYSSFFNGTMLHSNRHYSWASHILITLNGVAFNVPNIYKRKNPMENVYLPWCDVNIGEKLLALNYYAPTEFKLMKLSDSESKEERKNRKLAFFQKFKTIQMDKSKEHLEELRNNPDTKKKVLKQYNNYMSILLKGEAKRKAKEEKKRLKQEKKS